MPKGPQEARLERAVSGATRGAIQTAEEEWRNGARALDNVAMALDLAGPQVIAKFGGTHTGPAAQRAFQQVAEKVRARKAQMEQAADALANADVAVGEAKQVQASLGALPSEPARPDIAPGTNDADAVRQQRAYTTQLGGYHAAMADREAKAEAAVNEMDRVYRDSTATMKQVHGEPDRRAGGGAAAGGPGGGSTGTAGGSASSGSLAPGTTPATSAPAASHSTPGASTGVPHVVAPAGSAPAVMTAPGTAQDGAVLSTAPAAPGATGGPVSSSTSSGMAGGLVGALGGGMVGGAAGIGGAVRGGSVPVSTQSTAARAIGASPRTGAAGALGRGGAVAGSTTGATRAGATGATARTAGVAGPTARTAGAAGATGRVGAATGSTGRAGAHGVAGSAGSAGGRGQAAKGTGTRLGPRGGAIVTGRGGARSDEERTRRDELLESQQDWVDDEDANPGVID